MLLAPSHTAKSPRWLGRHVQTLLNSVNQCKQRNEPIPRELSTKARDAIMQVNQLKCTSRCEQRTKSCPLRFSAPSSVSNVPTKPADVQWMHPSSSSKTHSKSKSKQTPSPAYTRTLSAKYREQWNVTQHNLRAST